MFLFRLFHHPSLYKHYHKQHHEWTAPIGIVSIYAHPLEHVVNKLLLRFKNRMFPLKADNDDQLQNPPDVFLLAAC